MSALELDAVVVGAPDVGATVAAYRTLLGRTPVPTPTGARFALAPGAVEIAPGAGRLEALRFRGFVAAPSFQGLRVEPTTNAGPPAPSPGPADVATGIDHVVVRSPDPARAIALWRDRLGLRLALDRAFPDRGLRLLFFRTGGITLEYATPEPCPADARGDDVLWGVSYRVADVHAARARLVAAGLDTSPVRPGMQPGTHVCTVRTGAGGVPTLLIQPARRP